MNPADTIPTNQNSAIPELSVAFHFLSALICVICG